MKKISLLVFLTFVFFILDNTFMPFIAIKGYYPSLLFLFCICYSIVNGSWEGMWLGMISGMLQDIYFTNAFGINSLTTMLMCVLAGMVGRNLFKEKIIIPIVTTFFITSLKCFFVFTLLYAIGQHTNLQGVFYVAFYTMIISIVMYKWVYNLCQKEYMEIKWKF
jgi:rod shape-determining protein MreD